MEKKNYSFQTALFRDPVSQRMKASQLVLSEKHRENSCRYLNRIYVSNVNTCAEDDLGEYNIIKTLKNELLGIEFTTPTIKDQPWAKSIVFNCRNAIVLDIDNDGIIESFYYFFTETWQELRERLGKEFQLDKSNYPRHQPGSICFWESDSANPLPSGGLLFHTTCLWKGLSDSGEPIEDAVILIDDYVEGYPNINKWPRLGFKLETKNIPEPILKEERNEN